MAAGTTLFATKLTKPAVKKPADAAVATGEPQVDQG